MNAAVRLYNEVLQICLFKNKLEYTVYTQYELCFTGPGC